MRLIAWPLVGSWLYAMRSELSSQLTVAPSTTRNPLGQTKSGVTLKAPATPAVPRSIRRPYVSPGRSPLRVQTLVVAPLCTTSLWPVRNCCPAAWAVSSTYWTVPLALL